MSDDGSLCYKDIHQITPGHEVKQKIQVVPGRVGVVCVYVCVCVCVCTRVCVCVFNGKVIYHLYLM